MSDSDSNDGDNKQGIDALGENTTVIAVNIASVGVSPQGKLPSLHSPVDRTPSNRSANESREHGLKGTKLGHRREKGGEVTYKKFETTQLMGSIQLGIQQSVGNLATQEDRDLLHTDFYTVETVVFSRDGSLQKTPAHNYSQFKFRTYAPLAFRKFRNIFEIEQDKFLVSLCGEPMRELSNPGASGSIFYVTHDDEIICKTVSHKESRFLQEILQAYYLNLHQNFRTLLPKFFGFYCYSCNTKNVRIVVMKNLLPSGLPIHHKFDLKGSTYGRRASKKERAKSHPTFKDLDFMEMYSDGIFLQPELYHSLLDTMERDCRALESLEIMDYSLLVGIHNIDQGLSERKNSSFDREESMTTSDGIDNDDLLDEFKRRPPMLERVGSFQQRQRLVAHSTALESITAEVDDAAMADMVDECETVNKVTTWGGIPAKTSKGDNLLLFVGIIDILQSFGITKKLEHTWKSFIHDGDTVSVHRPSFYAERFKKFMGETVFRRMTAPLKPTLSFRKSHGFPKRAPKEKEDGKQTVSTRPDGPHRRSQSTSEHPAGVTVITIRSSEGDGSGCSGSPGILPAVLRDKPKTKHMRTSRPDVADVVAVSCTPPPDLAGITLGDEKVQIYVPSPQVTPYSTLTKQTLDTHRTITFLTYSEDSQGTATDIQSHVEKEVASFTSITEMSSTLQEEPVSISQVKVDVENSED